MIFRATDSSARRFRVSRSEIVVVLVEWNAGESRKLEECINLQWSDDLDFLRLELPRARADLGLMPSAAKTWHGKGALVQR
jgi:hypothetical protein